MTIVLKSGYKFLELLQSNGVDCILEDDAQKKDIRELRIGILNIMPKADSYEFNLLYPLGVTLLQINHEFIKLNNHTYSSTSKEHLSQNYVDFEKAISNGNLDGLIVTGAPVEHLDFKEINYWNEINEILDYADENIPSVLGICWGGLAIAKRLGIDKFNYDNKVFGVYKGVNLNGQHPLMRTIGDEFFCPQSRNAGISDSMMEKASDDKIVNLLAYNNDAGYFMFESADGKYLANLGHPEYHRSRIVYEARRDSITPKNFDIEKPINNWRGYRFSFFSGWLKGIYDKINN